MNKHIRVLQVLAGIASVLIGTALGFGLTSDARDPTMLPAIFELLLATLFGLSTWFAVRAQSPKARAEMRAVWRAGMFVGGLAFAVGFLGPIVFSRDSNQGPLLGFLVTGPLGFVAGIVGGLSWRLWRRPKSVSARTQDEFVSQTKQLSVQSLVSIGNGRLAAVVDGSSDPYLQFVYRAGLGIYWNPDLRRFEDRIGHETTHLESCQRIARAVREELGIALRLGSATRWEGIQSEERAAVRAVLR